MSDQLPLNQFHSMLCIVLVGEQMHMEIGRVPLSKTITMYKWRPIRENTSRQLIEICLSLDNCPATIQNLFDLDQLPFEL